MDGVLRTEDAQALHGTTRALVLELARGIVPVSLQAVRQADLGRLAEMFLTSVLREVLGVVRVDDVRIGRGVTFTYALATGLPAACSRNSSRP